jgi:predicted transcriptional regulator
MRGKTIGDQELALLQYIDEHAPASVGEVASGYGRPVAWPVPPC